MKAIREHFLPGADQSGHPGVEVVQRYCVSALTVEEPFFTILVVSISSHILRPEGSPALETQARQIVLYLLMASIFLHCILLYLSKIYSNA